jgi:hypothetical protein
MATLRREKVKTSGPENETHLFAARLPGREPVVCRSDAAAKQGIRCRAGLQEADGNHLVP